MPDKPTIMLSGIDAITGQKDTSTLAGRKRERLLMWLLKDNWKPDESRMILSGLDPKKTVSLRKNGWWALPQPETHSPNPAANALKDEEDKKSEDEEYEDQMWDRFSRIDGLKLKTAPPIKIIETAYEAGIIIPWLLIAVHDKYYKLPLSFRNTVISKEQEKTEKRAIFDKRNANKIALNADKRAPKIAAIRNLIDGLDLKDCRKKSGEINRSEVIRRIFETHPDWVIKEETLRNWFKEYDLIP